MGYWNENYRDKIGNKSFIEGVIAAINTYGVWNDGKQYIGVMRQPIPTAIADVKTQLEWKE